MAHEPSRKNIYSVLIRNNLFMHKGQDQVNFVEVYQVQCTSVRKESLTRKFMKTSYKLLGRSLLLLYSEKWASEFKRGRENVEDDGRSGRPKDATSDENVKVVHILVVCDRRRDLRSIASEVGIRFGT